MPTIDVPGKGLVEFPYSMSQDEILEAVQQLTAPERPPGEGTPKPTFLGALGQSAKERLGELPQFFRDLPGMVTKDVKQAGATLSDPNLPLRLSSATVPGAGPALSSALNLGTEGLAQYREGGLNPRALALSTLPAVLAGGARAVRAGERMVTRTSPSRFAAKHQEAMDAAKDLTTGLRPDTRTLYNRAEAAKTTAPPIDLTETGRSVAELRGQQARVPALSPESEATRSLTEKVAPLSQPSMSLTDLDAWMRELNQAISSRAPGKSAATLLSGSAVKDLETAASAGNQGADLARQAAQGYKAQLGAGRLEDMVTKASPPLTGQAPALNIRDLEKRVRLDKDLPRLVGPDGMAQVNEFLEKYRSLPPDTAARWGSMLLATIGGGAGYAGGSPLKALVGALAGAVGPEFARNLMYVGANPTALNQGLTTIGQGLRPVLGGLSKALGGP